jgi:hypothetical protein
MTNRTRRVTLELLRHGPAHNQLLSPLTQYMALCGNHHGETVHVPYEHNQFLARHSSLMYEDSLDPNNDDARERRELQLQITAQEMSTILMKIPGLISELRPSGDSDEFIHLEVILSASELALLPFELATAPNGFPGAGQSLTLQTQAPLSMTRRVRRVNNGTVRWPTAPRILFVESLPPADAQTLVPAHMLALRKALDPWVRKDTTNSTTFANDYNDVRVPQSLKKLITVLPQASVEDVMRALRNDHYTHVHFLAHGKSFKEGIDDRFGLEFYEDHDPSKSDIVSGTRLAAMIKSCADEGVHSHCPAVISIASCYGSNGGSVVGAGSSVAHHLHEAGMPLVVSSLFTLSFDASVMLTEQLYTGLLWGKDPRRLLHCLRRDLRAAMPRTHDWASLVAYAAFPDDFSRQLRETKILQSQSSIRAAFSFSDNYAHRWQTWYDDFDELLSVEPDQSEKKRIREELEEHKLQSTSEIELVRQKIDPGKRRLNRIISSVQASQRSGFNSLSGEELARVYGLLATTEKREAELQWIETLIRQWTSDELADDSKPDVASSPPDWTTALQSSRAHYRQVFDIHPKKSWALTQWLVLSVVETISPQITPLKDEEKNDKWKVWSRHLKRLIKGRNLTKATLDDQSESESRRVRRLAISNQIDLKLLDMFFWEEHFDGDVHPTADQVEYRFEKIRSELRELAHRLVEICDERDWEIVSRQRQLLRYINWFFFYDHEFEAFEGLYKVFPDDLTGLVKLLARETLDLLPDRTPTEEPAD